MSNSTAKSWSSRSLESLADDLCSKATVPPASTLSSLVERDESPPFGTQMNIDYIVKSPVAPANTATTQLYTMPGTFDTPPVSRVSAGLDEMHPSKVHQSTTKKSEPHSAAENVMTASPLQDTTFIQATPSKTRGSLPAHMSSPGFDFNFCRPESDLSDEAQKIMESVRGEAARIKAQMKIEREKQEQENGQSNEHCSLGNRKIAQPKGRAGRFSDVHKQQFQKMDSIANHASTWKNKIQTSTATGLKRSNSKAELDKAQDSQPKTMLPHSKSSKCISKPDDVEGLELPSPSKRMKRDYRDDASTTRPVSRDANTEHSVQNTPGKAQSSNLPSGITTPTKASLARAASIKTPKSSMIPSLARSASTKTGSRPAISRTEGNNKYFSSLIKFGSMKSILHRHQPKFSYDPAKVAAGTHLPVPTADFDKRLPSLPGTPSRQGFEHSPSMKTLKRVDFNLSPPKTAIASTTAISPSPSKGSQLNYPSIAAESPNVTTRNTHKIPTSNPAPVTGLPNDFTFSSASTIQFGPATSGLRSPPSGSTIRTVRPSGITTPLAESDGDNKVTQGMPAIPHGIGNKKRKHGGFDHEDGGNEENIAPGDRDGQSCSPVKKVKRDDHQIGKGHQKTNAAKSRLPKAKKEMNKGRGVLSLSRLNALARPKNR